MCRPWWPTPSPATNAPSVMPKWSNTSAPQASSSLLRFTGDSGSAATMIFFTVLDVEVEALRLGQVREVQAVARHAEPDRRLEVVDQLELRLRGRVGAGAAPHGADAVVDRGAGVEVRHRMHAEREGDVRAVVGGGADQRPGALEGAQAVLHVLGRARVEQRPAGGAARAPVLDHLGARLDAELVVEALGRDLPQLFLGEQRDLVPDVLGRAPGEFASSGTATAARAPPRPPCARAGSFPVRETEAGQFS